MFKSNSSQDKLSSDLTMNAVQLKVGDISVMTEYYSKALGLEVTEESNDGVSLGRNSKTLVRLQDSKGLLKPVRSEAGLFHTALLFDTKESLASTVLAAAEFDQSKFVGSSDHLVSEAFYFTDPEGNGIELYWDRPRDMWNWSEGQVAMDTIYLDPNKYLSENLTEVSVNNLKVTDAEIGHVHLQVGSIQRAREFYVKTLGFDETCALGNQALFVSAGGYHHHMAMNVWNSLGAGLRGNTLGLGEVLINVPTEEEVGKITERLNFAKIEKHHTGAELRFEDPWGNKLRVVVA